MLDSTPLLSIVIANFNCGRYLGAAIDSVVSQMNSEIELIVIDGCSTDNSVDVIRRYEHKISYWISEPDSGQSEAFNKGFTRAKGKYLTWLNADDILVPGAVASIVRVLNRHPECEWFTGNFVRFLNDSGAIFEVGWGPHVYPKWMQRRNSPIVVYGPSSVFSKSLWERCGKIDESLHFMMDMDMWMRFIVSGVKQCRIPNFIWAFRMHEESKTAEFGDHKMDQEKLKKFNLEAKRVFAKNGFRASKFWRYVCVMWRFFDGSIVKRFFLRRKLRMLKDLDQKSDLLLLDHPVGDYFRFQGWFCEALKARRFVARCDVRLPRKFRAFMGRLFGVAIGVRSRRLLVCGSHRIESCAWPWNYFFEIVPVMWDLWPGYYSAFKRFIDRNNVKTVICTAKQSVDWINENCPGTKAFWMPEAADAKSLSMGEKLASRPVDILAYGRPYDVVYQQAKEFAEKKGLTYQFGAGKTFDELTAAVRSAKIALCYPLCDTNPGKAQGVETLTQRYWEAMLSGTIMVGRAPKELIEVCGYNPVVETAGNVAVTLEKVLSNLADYQELSDRNRSTALAVGDWSARVDLVLNAVNNKEMI